MELRVYVKGRSISVYSYINTNILQVELSIHIPIP